MFKQIFSKKDGKPKLIQSSYDDDGEEVFEYDESSYSDTMPPSNLYDPIEYKDGEWIGNSYEEWLKELRNDTENEIEEQTPTDNEIEIAMLSKQLFDTKETLQGLQQDFVDLLKYLNESEEEQNG